MKNSSYVLKPEELMTHRGFVRNLALKLIRDEHAAEDITQETWMAALEHPVRSDKPVRAWLYTVVKNLAIRTKWRQSQRLARERAAAQPIAVRSTDEIVEREAMRRQVVDTVFSLKEPYRSAILYRYYDDLPPRKIAKKLKIPVDTVKTHLKRGLQRMRQKLDTAHGGNKKAWLLALAPLAGLDSIAAAAPLLLSGGITLSGKIKAAMVGLVLLGGALTVGLFVQGEESPKGQEKQLSQNLGEVKKTGAPAENKTVNPEETERIRPKSAHIIFQGFATDEFETPQAGAPWRLVDRKGKVLNSGVTKDNGFFQTEANPTDMPDSLMFGGSGWLPARFQLPPLEEVFDDVEDLSNVEIVPAGVLKITLTAPDRPLLSKVKLTLINEQDQPLHLYSNEKTPLLQWREPPILHQLIGPMEFSQLPRSFTAPSKTMRLRVEAEGYPVLESGFFNILQHGIAELALELSHSDSIQGTCVDQSGSPLSGVKMKAMPLREGLGPNDYVVVSEHRRGSESGTTVVKTVSAITDQDGCFHFFSLPRGVRYQVFCEDPRYLVIQSSIGEDHIVPAGASDLKFVLKHQPVLYLTLDGAKGEGPGMIDIYVEHQDHSGWRDTIPVKTLSCTLPLHCQRVLEPGEKVRVYLRAHWGKGIFGDLEFDLSWHQDAMYKTVLLSQGFYCTLGVADFSFCSLVASWSKQGKTLLSTSYSYECKMPICSFSLYDNPSYILDTDPITGAYWIASPQSKLDWITLWHQGFQGIYVAKTDPNETLRKVVSRYSCKGAERLSICLRDSGFLTKDHEIRGVLEARYPSMCGNVRLGHWLFEMNGTPGKEVHIWPSSPYQYSPAPNPEVVFWRPPELEYVLKASIRSRTDDHKPIPLLNKTFVLKKPTAFFITIPYDLNK